MIDRRNVLQLLASPAVPGLLSAPIAPVTWLISLTTMLVQPQSRRIGDLAAGTFVVHERAPSAWRWTPSGSCSPTTTPSGNHDPRVRLSRTRVHPPLTITISLPSGSATRQRPRDCLK